MSNEKPVVDNWVEETVSKLESSELFFESTVWKEFISKAEAAIKSKELEDLNKLNEILLSSDLDTPTPQKENCINREIDIVTVAKNLRDKCGIDPKFFEDVKNCFHPKEMFSEKNITDAENDDTIIMDGENGITDISDAELEVNLVGTDTFGDDVSDEETKVMSPDRFTNDGSKIEDHIVSKLGKIDYLKNISDQVIMTGEICPEDYDGKEYSMKPYVSMAPSSILKLDGSLRKKIRHDKRFVNYLKNGMIGRATDQEVVLLKNHLKYKQVEKTEKSDNIVDANFIIEMMMGQLRDRNLHRDYYDVLFDKYHKKFIGDRTMDRASEMEIINENISDMEKINSASQVLYKKTEISLYNRDVENKARKEKFEAENPGKTLVLG
jgi:hypothetical protein